MSLAVRLPVIGERSKPETFCFIMKGDILLKTAIFVDGGFYRRVAQAKLGDLSPEARAIELENYCRRHLKYAGNEPPAKLYRIFYYDCPPMNKKVFHPLLNRTVDYSKTSLHSWNSNFLEELKKRRKFALRLGYLSEEHAHFSIKYDILKKLCNLTKKIEDLTENDFQINVDQKGVDIKIGIDIASLAYKKQVDQIILISGDSDFVPAAKLARREGIDFILDPLYTHIKPDLFEHIDGLRTCDPRFKPNYK